MKSDNLRNFTVRFLESALRRVDATAKPFYGGRLSTGEAIRRLAEERLEEIEAFGPRDSAPEALLPLLSAWRSGQTLALDDLQFLARSVNSAYQSSGQDHVSRDLLIANVSAFREAVRLLARGKSKGIEVEDEYFLRNLATPAAGRGKTLLETIDQWISRLRDRPSAQEAEFASRNLWSCLRDERFPDEAQLARAIQPYVAELLQVAIRGYWDRERQPLIERRKGPPMDDAPPRLVSPVTVGAITLRPLLQEHGISVSVELGEHTGFSARNFVELEDLAEVTRLAEAGNDARGSKFEWMIHGDRSKHYRLSSGGCWWQLEPNDFTSLAHGLDTLFRDPTIAELVERLRYVYGRI